MQSTFKTAAALAWFTKRGFKGLIFRIGAVDSVRSRSVTMKTLQQHGRNRPTKGCVTRYVPRQMHQNSERSEVNTYYYSFAVRYASTRPLRVLFHRNLAAQALDLCAPFSFLAPSSGERSEFWCNIGAYISILTNGLWLRVSLS